MIEADVLTYLRLAISLGDGQRIAHAARRHLAAHAVVNGLWSLVERGFLNLPGRPGWRVAVVEHHKADALAAGHQLALCLLVVERLYVAIFIHTQPIALVLNLAARLRLRGGLRSPRHAVDGHTRRRQRGLEHHLSLVGQILRRHLLSVRPGNGHPACRIDADQRLHGEGLSVIHYQRRAAHLGVHAAGNARYAGGHHIGKLLQADELVVPRELVGPGDRGAGQVVVKLMPDDPSPCVGHLADRIFTGSQPVGNDGRALGSITQVLVLTVVELHRSLRRIASVAVQVHRELALELRQPSGIGLSLQLGSFEGGQVFIQLVAGGRYNLHRAVALDALLYGTYRRDVGRAANIARTIISVCDVQRTLTRLAHELLAAREVFVGPALGIVKAVHHHHLAAVDAFPQAYGERILLVALIEGLRAPHQLLR